MAKIEKNLDDLENMPEYQCGLWYSPYVKIYSIGGSTRVAEISTYPRAHKDTTPHVYTKDIPFIVVEGDLDHEIEGEQFHLDSKENLYRIGEKATHWAGDPLPGAFPLWIESENLPFTPKPGAHVFHVTDMPGRRISLIEAGIKVGPILMKLPEPAIEVMRKNLPTGQITIGRKPADLDKQIIRIKYCRGR